MRAVRPSACAAIAALSCLAAPAAAAAKKPGLFAGSYPVTFPVRPATVGGWTGDGTGILGGTHAKPARHRFGHIRWRSWTAHRAVGRAVPWGNDCDPDCAGGSWKPDPPTKVTAWRARHGHFTRLAFAYDSGSGPRRHVFRFTRAGGGSWR
jgi:hypothetical protein